MVSDGCYSWKDTVADSALDKIIAKQAERTGVKQWRLSVILAQSMVTS